MTRDRDDFEAHLAESLARLAGEAPAEPDAASVLAALRRRTSFRVVRLGAAAAACALLTVGVLAWLGRRGSPPVTAPVGSAPPPVCAAPAASPGAPPGVVPPLPALSVAIPTVRMGPAALRLDVPAMPAGGELGGPAAGLALRCNLTSLSCRLRAGRPGPTSHERKLP
jgi:hypothetical protein